MAEMQVGKECSGGLVHPAGGWGKHECCAEPDTWERPLWQDPGLGEQLGDWVKSH